MQSESIKWSARYAQIRKEILLSLSSNVDLEQRYCFRTCMLTWICDQKQNSSSLCQSMQEGIKHEEPVSFICERWGADGESRLRMHEEPEVGQELVFLSTPK